MRCLYIFLDESGNFDFSPAGTPYFVMTAAITEDPLKSAGALQSLKYAMLAEGTDVECFHASPDRQAVRDRVLPAIASLDGIRYHHISLEKRKAYAAYRTPAAIYALCGKTLLNYILRGKAGGSHGMVVIIFDKALTRKDQEAFLKAVKPELKTWGKPYRIYFHQTMADFNGQIADYGAWAKYVSLARGEGRPLAALSCIPQTHFDIFAKGTTNYY